jgi:hypothetical protein
MEPTINADAVLDPENFSFPHGTHLCAVEVDTETGRPTIRKYVAVDDIGNVINPLIVEGQVHGGLAQGIAQALYEEAVYDADANLVTGTMVDYLVPSAADLPEFTTDRTETPSTTNPLGVKGVGEAGTIASTPAVVGAVVDAVHHSASGDPDAHHARTGLAGDQQLGLRRRRPGRRGHHRVRRPADLDDGRRCRVIPPEFDYLRPHSVDEAVTELGRAGEDAKVLAGGQSLLPLLRLRLAYPTVLVDLGGVGELRGVRRDGDELVIGSMTTHHEVMHDPLVAEHCPLLAQATSTVADPAVRHRGTFGGALSHADPAGDLPAVAAALEATFVIEGPNGRRSVPAASSSPTTWRRPCSRARCWSRSGCRCSARLGQRVREVQPGRPGRGRSSAWPRWSAPRAARSPRPGSG